MNLFEETTNELIPPSEISKIGVQEKYLRAGHYNAIKVWWARRPIMSMRHLLINELVKHYNFTKSYNKNLITELNPDIELLTEFKNEFGTGSLKVLDVFSGGGSIPLESSRLGFETYSSELNPVAHLGQRTIFESVKYKDFTKILKEEGTKIINNTKKRVDFIYDIDGKKPFVIFWGKYLRCTNCNTDVNLSRISYLSKRKNQHVVYNHEGNTIEFVDDVPKEKTERSKKNAMCSKCYTEYDFKKIKEYCKTQKLIYKPLVIQYREKSGKQFTSLDENKRTIFVNIDNLISEKLSELNYLIPNEKVEFKSGVINPTIYDLKYPADYFSNRQLFVLLTTIDEIVKSYKEYVTKYGNEVSEHLILSLTPLIEHLVDWNSVSTMWISQNEQAGRSLAGPGVSMKWDFLEINPFLRIGANLYSKLDRVCSTLDLLHQTNSVTQFKGSSVSIPLQDNFIDIVLTDPPYFDSIDYTALSEFFRSWFEVLIRNTYDKNINLKNDVSKEAIVELSNKKKRGSDHYKEIMTGVSKEVHRVLKEDGKYLMLYAHKTLEGWKVISESFKESGFYITECIPLEMERIARPRSMNSQALNGVIVFVMSKNNNNIQSVEHDIYQLNNKLKNEVFLESNLVIYLSSLACKLYTLSNLSFEECKDKVQSLYKETNSDDLLNMSIDIMTKNYLSLYTKMINDLTVEESKILFENGLVDEKNNLKKLTELKLQDIKNESSDIYGVVKIINDYKNTSTTIIKVNPNKKNQFIKIFSILSGTELNTVSKRSSDVEVKLSREILNRIQ